MTDIETLIDSIKNDAEIRQVLIVRQTEGSNASAGFYVRQSSGEFSLITSCDAFIGKNGMGKEKEGDGKTPEGVFGIRKAFGIKPNPGTGIEYLPVQETTWACDEDCEYYNRIVDVSQTGHRCRGEHMIEYTDAYAYGLETDYNSENIYPKGSAIFIHCKGRNPWTHGCVALDEDVMRTILVQSDKNLKVIMGA